MFGFKKKNDQDKAKAEIAKRQAQKNAGKGKNQDQVKVDAKNETKAIKAKNEPDKKISKTESKKSDSKDASTKKATEEKSNEQTNKRVERKTEEIAKPIIISFKANGKIIRNDLTLSKELGAELKEEDLPKIKGYRLNGELPKIKVTNKLQKIKLDYNQLKVKITLVPVNEQDNRIANAPTKTIELIADEKLDLTVVPKVAGYYTFARDYIVPDHDGDLNIVYGPSQQKFHVICKTDSGVTLKDFIINGATDEKYEINPEEHSFYGYELDKLPRNLSGHFSQKNQDVVLTYHPVPTTLTVSFLDEMGNKVHKPLTFKDGFYKGTYSIKVPPIDGYELTSDPQILNGKYNRLQEDIVLRFKKEVKQITIKLWFDQEHSKSAGKDIILNGVTGNSYSKTLPTIPGFNADKTIIKGSFDNNKNKIIDVVYTPIRCKVIVAFQDEAGRTIQNIKPIEKIGNWGDKYEIKLPTISGFENEKDELKGTFNNLSETLITYYKPKKVDVTVKYINVKTHKEIPHVKADNKKVIVGSSFEVEPKTIVGYRLTELPKNSSGIVPDKNTEIIFNYEPYKANLIIHYFDVTYNQIKPEKVIEGYYGMPIDYKPDELKGYSFDKSSGPLNMVLKNSRTDIDLIYNPQTVEFKIQPVDQFGKAIGADYTQVVTGLVGQSFSIQLPSIAGYEVDNYIVNGVIESNYDQKVFKINYRPLPAAVTIRTVIKGGALDGQVPYEDTVINGKMGEQYKYEIQPVMGHHTKDSIIEGIFDNQQQDIQIAYEVNEEEYLIQFADENANLVGGLPKTKGLFGDEIEVNSHLPKGYLLPQGMENAKVTLNGSHVYRVTVYPKPITVDLIAQTEDGQLLNGVQKQVIGRYHEPQTIDLPSITGYQPVEGNKIEINFELDQRELPIFYRPEEKNVTVRYLSTQGEPLSEPKQVKGKFGSEYTIKAKEIDGYFPVDAKSKHGIFDNNDLELAFIYRAGSDSMSAAVASLEDIMKKQEAHTNEEGNKENTVNTSEEKPKNLITDILGESKND